MQKYELLAMICGKISSAQSAILEFTDGDFEANPDLFNIYSKLSGIMGGVIDCIRKDTDEALRKAKELLESA